MKDEDFNETIEIEKREGFKLSEVIIIVLITCSISIFAGISYGKVKYSDTVNINDITSSNKESNDELSKFIKEYKYIISNYYDSSKIKEKDLLKIALQSILNELGIEDVYSTYMDDETYEQFNINLNGSYEGLGIRSFKDSDNSYITVYSIIEDSPASKLDIKTGDIILSIDGKDTREMELTDFSNYVLKSKDKIFVLKLKRDDKEFSLKIEKSKITIKSVNSKIIERDDKKIGYINVSIFASNSYTQFKKNLSDLEKEGIDSLIIDLRSNNGGYLTEVTKILNLFLEKRKVVYQLQKNNDKVKYYSKGKENKKYPIVFLGNETTASASELFIISLKENLDAKLVGMKTYGKGTVQELVQLSNGDQYKITTKRWLSPKGNWINDTKGIEPDVEVQLDIKYLEDPSEKNDNQLETAIKEVLKK